MKLRRGFKAESERLAAEVRRELGLRATDRLVPQQLAGHLGIPLFGLAEFGRVAGCPSAAQHFREVEPEAFSGMTYLDGTRRLIIYNDAHAPTRQASDITHELAHCLLEHPPDPPVGPLGCRYWHDEKEAEATWLAGVLLVPRAGALLLAQRGLDLAMIADEYGISLPLCRWRVQQTGVDRQVARTSGRFRQA